MVRKGRFNISILVSEAKIESTKTKMLNALNKLRDDGDIESAEWKLTYEEMPESGTV